MQDAGAERLLSQRILSVREEVKALTYTASVMEKANALLVNLGDTKQASTQRQIEDIVTRGLQTIFGERYSFHLVENIKAKTPTVDFIIRDTLIDGTQQDTAVLDSRGGGLIVTIGFLLRAVIMLLRGTVRGENILLLDETFAMVSAEYLDKLGAFLQELAEQTGIQLVMVTHQPVFAEYADKVYSFTFVNGETKAAQDA